MIEDEWCSRLIEGCNEKQQLIHLNGHVLYKEVELGVGIPHLCQIIKYLATTRDYIIYSVVILCMQVPHKMATFNKHP